MCRYTFYTQKNQWQSDGDIQLVGARACNLLDATTDNKSEKRNAPLSVTEKHTPTNNNEYRHLSSWRRTISLLSFMLSSYIFLATFPLVKRNACGAAFVAFYSFIYSFFFLRLSFQKTCRLDKKTQLLPSIGLAQNRPDRSEKVSPSFPIFHVWALISAVTYNNLFTFKDTGSCTYIVPLPP